MSDKEFKCQCGRMFKSYHDGDGINTGFCPRCQVLQATVGLDEKKSYWMEQYMETQNKMVLVEQRISALEAIVKDRKEYDLYLAKGGLIEQMIEQIAELQNRIVDVSELKQQMKLVLGVQTQINELKKKVNEINSGCGKFEMDYVKQIAELKELYQGLWDSHYNFTVVRLNKTDKVLGDHIDKHIKVADADRDDLNVIHSWKGNLILQLEKLDVGSARQTDDEDSPERTKQIKAMDRMMTMDLGLKETEKKEDPYIVKFRDIIIDVIDIMGYNKEDTEAKEIREYLEGIDNEYILIKKASRGEKELPNRENDLNHSYGINGEPNVHHSKLPETEPENPDDREFIHFDEKLWISLSKHAQKQKELIEDIQDDLDSLNPDIPYAYEPLNVLKKKWQGRIK